MPNKAEITSSNPLSPFLCVDMSKKKKKIYIYYSILNALSCFNISNARKILSLRLCPIILFQTYNILSIGVIVETTYFLK
jgi:hypothetical protein